MNQNPNAWVLDRRFSRVIQGALANIFGLVVRIGLQIVQVPLFLHFWSADRYGEWLVVSSVPAYLSLSGLGFGSAAGNAVANLSAQNNMSAVRAIVRTALLITTGSCALASAFIIGVVTTFDVPRLLDLHEIVGTQLASIVSLWCMIVMLRMIFGLSETVLRAVGKYPIFIVLDNCAQIFEFIAMSCALYLYGTPLAVVSACFLARFMITVLTTLGFISLYSWTYRGPADPLLPWAKRLMKPSIAFLVIPISQSMTLQGTLLIASHYFGPSAVASIATARTLGRLIETGLNIINNLVFEEVGYAAGASDRAGLKWIVISSMAASIIVGIGATGFLLLIGPSIYSLWTHSKLSLDYGILIAVMAAGIVRAIASPSTALLAGLNRHGRYSLVLLVSTIASLALAILLEAWGLVAIAASPLLAELSVAFYVLPRGLRAANLSWGELGSDFAEASRHHWNKVKRKIGPK